MSFVPPLNQVAFSVVDLRRTEQWFREGLGLLPAGGSRRMMRGPIASRVQGLPGAASTCWWLVGRNPWLQLEFFQFERPIAELMPFDARPCDIGYRRVGFWVADFDGTLARLRALGSPPLSEPQGARGRRRACVRSPDGVYVEIMESDPLGSSGAGRQECPVAIRSVSLSVPDLDASVAFFGGALGLPAAGTSLHTQDRPALWGQAGARAKSVVLQAGDVLLEIEQYLDPVGQPWPAGYRISDQGILNIAFGARSKADHTAVYNQVLAAGARPNCRPFHLPVGGVVYVNDPQGFSVELLWAKPGRGDRDWGFEPLPLDARPDPDTHSVTRSVRVAAPIERAWSVVMDHEGMADWSGFKPVTLDRAGTPDPQGYGAERRMKGPLGTVVEQVIDVDAPRSCRYRVIEGSPFVCHQGEIRLVPRGRDTEITWTIRFRPRIPGTGALFQSLLGRLLGDVLQKGLRRTVERG